MLYISVQQWGDFDIPYTAVVLYSEEYSDRDSLVKEFIAKEKLLGCSYKEGHVGDLQYVEQEECNFSLQSDLNDLSDKFIDFLKKKGFKELKTQDVSFSD